MFRERKRGVQRNRITVHCGRESGNSRRSPWQRAAQPTVAVPRIRCCSFVQGDAAPEPFPLPPPPSPWHHPAHPLTRSPAHPQRLSRRILATFENIREHSRTFLRATLPQWREAWRNAWPPSISSFQPRILSLITLTGADEAEVK